MKEDYLPIKPMLSEEYDWSQLTSPYIVQPKLMGVRAFIYKGRVYGRTREAFNVFDDIPFGQNIAENFILDGELYVHGWNQERIQGAIIRDEPSEDTRSLEFHWFDSINLLDPRLNYYHRYLNIPSLGFHEKIFKVETHTSTEVPYSDWYRVFTNFEYEGAMYRDPQAVYCQGRRSYTLMKRKAWRDSEAKIHDIIEGEGKCQEMTGALNVEWNNLRFNIGGGMDDATRLMFWRGRDLFIGRTITFRYRYLSRYGTPISPQFCHLRPQGV